jgi:DNA-binding transcriptional ArsR family regulator
MKESGTSSRIKISEHIGMDIQQVRISLIALASENPPFFQFYDHTAMGEKLRAISGIHEPTGHARRAVGTWPTPENQVDQLTRALILTAEREQDQEKSGMLRKAAAYIAGVGRDVAIGVITGTIAN